MTHHTSNVALIISAQRSPSASDTSGLLSWIRAVLCVWSTGAGWTMCPTLWVLRSRRTVRASNVTVHGIDRRTRPG